MDDIHKHFWFHHATQLGCPKNVKKKIKVKEPCKITVEFEYEIHNDEPK
jgi:hypothetical protein